MTTPSIRTLAMPALAAAFFLAGCVPAAPPAAPPQPPPSAPLAPPSPPLAADWRDWPIAAGDWRYAANATATTASFGQTGQSALLVVQCALATRQVAIQRLVTDPAASVAEPMTVNTSFGAAQWPVAALAPAADPASEPAYVVATRASADEALDRIAFSRGRFTIEVPGAAPLAVPTWAEISRVIEDCRA